jgi:hypothetical protein
MIATIHKLFTKISFLSQYVWMKNLADAYVQH